MTQPNAPGDRTADAIECFSCLIDPDAEPALRARWTAWLGESAENRAAYHAVRDTWNRPVPRDAWPTHEEIVNDQYDGTNPIPPKTGGGGRRFMMIPGLSPIGSRLVLVAGALVVAVMIAGLWRTRSVVPETPDTVAYRTGRGEQRRIALADGSAITLGPLSNLRVMVGGQGRSAQLDEGEAIFAINHDPAQPFKLAANGGEIEDVGTTFGVEIRSNRATVTVVEGAVRVSTAASNGSPAVLELQHDQQVTFGRELGPVGAIDGRGETDWSRGRHAYLDRPLADVVADLTRYPTRDLVLADQAVGALHYTGTIEADAIDQWAAALTRVFPVDATHEGNRLILRSAPKN